MGALMALLLAIVAGACCVAAVVWGRSAVRLRRFARRVRAEQGPTADASVLARASLRRGVVLGNADRHVVQFHLLHAAGLLPIDIVQPAAAARARVVCPDPVFVQFLRRKPGSLVPLVPWLTTDLAFLPILALRLLLGRIDDIARRRFRGVARVLLGFRQLGFQTLYTRLLLREALLLLRDRVMQLGTLGTSVIWRSVLHDRQILDQATCALQYQFRIRERLQKKRG
jgi:hypothetical protein